MKTKPTYQYSLPVTKAVEQTYPRYMQITGRISESKSTSVNDWRVNDVFYGDLIVRDIFIRETEFYLDGKSIKCSEEEWWQLMDTIAIKSPRSSTQTTHSISKKDPWSSTQS